MIDPTRSHSAYTFFKVRQGFSKRSAPFIIACSNIWQSGFSILNTLKEKTVI